MLRWHRQGFRLFWKRKSRVTSAKSKLLAESAALIKEMAAHNRLWGAERIQGELRKLGLRVSKRTIQKHMRGARPPRPGGQSWATFLRTHAGDIWACDFLQLTDLWFRPLVAFFVVELASRRVVHVGVTRQPSDAWAAQQLREATPFGAAPGTCSTTATAVREALRPGRGGEQRHRPRHTLPGAARQRRLRTLPCQRAA